jgi:hypothetical protein
MLTDDLLRTFGKEMLADCRTVEGACKAAGLPAAQLPEWLTFLREHGLERTLFALASQPLAGTCSMCRQASVQCRCDAPIGYLPTQH